MAKKKTETDGTEDKKSTVYQRGKLRFKLNIIHRNDLTEKQKDFIDLALDKKTQVIFVSGPSGTGKTFLSVYCLLMLLSDKKIRDITYVRSVAESGSKELGFLPGEINDKIKPYLMPLEDKLKELLPQDDIAYLMKDNRLHGNPINYMRGASLVSHGVICDEAQNLTVKELTTLITRIGKFSRTFIIGDFMQSDIGNKSGFKKFYDAFNTEESRENGIHCFEFTKDDIVRSGILKYIIDVVENIT